MSSSIVSETPTVAAEPASQTSKFRILAFKITLLLTILIVGGELVCRAFWVFERRAPLLARKSLWYAYYPQMRTSGVENAALTRNADNYDILILGGSTISEDFGDIGKKLGAGMQKRLGKSVRVFNLAFAGHNSRDSMLKHRWLADQRFDLVVAYDGINDTRMNNAPLDHFRDDYSHCHWYQCVNRLDTHPILYQAALPFTLQFTADRIANETGLKWYATRLNPTDDAVQYGQHIRTPATFQRNLREIVTSAKSRGERMVVMTFSHYLPPIESQNEPAAKDSASQKPFVTNVEIWGKREYVLTAMQQQNDAVRELVKQHPEVVFIDQEKLMTCNRKNFIDCCHFTDVGCTEFTQHVLAALDARK